MSGVNGRNHLLFRSLVKRPIGVANGGYWAGMDLIRGGWSVGRGQSVKGYGVKRAMGDEVPRNG